MEYNSGYSIHNKGKMYNCLTPNLFNLHCIDRSLSRRLNKSEGGDGGRRGAKKDVDLRFV